MVFASLFCGLMVAKKIPHMSDIELFITFWLVYEGAQLAAYDFYLQRRNIKSLHTAIANDAWLLSVPKESAAFVWCKLAMHFAGRALGLHLRGQFELGYGFR